MPVFPFVVPGSTKNMKRLTAEALADFLSSNIPALTGKVHTTAPGPEEKASWPCATVLADGRMDFEAHNDVDVWWDEATDTGQVVIEVGEFSGTFEIRLYASSVPQREALEQAVIDLFMSSSHRPGTVLVSATDVPVMGSPTAYDPILSFSLEDAQWREEFAWENRRFSFLDVQVEFPALVLQDAWTLQSLRLAINGDLLSDTPDEVVEIEEDGTIVKSS